MLKFSPLVIEKKDERHLTIKWSDAQTFHYQVAELRRACGCAHCVDELTGRQILKPEQVPDSVRPIKVRSMGRYALVIDWNDGHSSSIFSWARLRKLAGFES